MDKGLQGNLKPLGIDEILLCGLGLLRGLRRAPLKSIAEAVNTFLGQHVIANLAILILRACVKGRRAISLSLALGNHDARGDEHRTSFTGVGDGVVDVPREPIGTECGVRHGCNDPPSRFLKIQILPLDHENIQHHVNKDDEQRDIVDDPQASVQHLHLLDRIVRKHIVRVGERLVELGEHPSHPAAPRGPASLLGAGGRPGDAFSPPGRRRAQGTLRPAKGPEERPGCLKLTRP
mmetsp:Transcript_50458/g.108054  ORF Transcript_50458/g.108054 Transcript_50458/m.108054 type:complete len:235 (+) Transcript_50458:616-1320(+)